MIQKLRAGGVSYKKESPVQDALGWCTGIAQMDGTGREVGEGFRMGDTCTPMADSC